MCPCSAKPYAVLCSVALRGTVHNSAVCITALCTRQGSEITVDHGRSCSAPRSHTYPRGACVAGHRDLNFRVVKPHCHSGCGRRTRVVRADGQGQGTLLMVRSTKHAYAVLRRQLQQRVHSYYLVKATSKTVSVAMLEMDCPRTDRRRDCVQVHRCLASMRQRRFYPDWVAVWQTADADKLLS